MTMELLKLSIPFQSAHLPRRRRSTSSPIEEEERRRGAPHPHSNHRPPHPHPHPINLILIPSSSSPRLESSSPLLIVSPYAQEECESEAGNQISGTIIPAGNPPLEIYSSPSYSCIYNSDDNDDDDDEDDDEEEPEDEEQRRSSGLIPIVSGGVIGEEMMIRGIEEESHHQNVIRTRATDENSNRKIKKKKILLLVIPKDDSLHIPLNSHHPHLTVDPHPQHQPHQPQDYSEHHNRNNQSNYNPNSFLSLLLQLTQLSPTLGLNFFSSSEELSAPPSQSLKISSRTSSSSGRNSQSASWTVPLSSFPFQRIIPLFLLLTTTTIITTTTTAQGTGTNETRLGHRCYVCLPADKTSHEASEILSLFPPEQHYNVPDCIAFGPHNAHQFEFTCPEKYVGCLRRALGNNRALVSRTCVNLAINDCKVANAVEYCYCSGALCNGEKNYTSTDDTAGYWNRDITDDEDLLGPNVPLEGSGEEETEATGKEEEEESRDGSHQSGDNSRNPLKPSTSQEHLSPTGRRTHSGSSIPASSNKGTRKDAVLTSGAYSLFLERSQSSILLVLLLLIVPRILSLQHCPNIVVGSPHSLSL